MFLIIFILLIINTIISHFLGNYVGKNGVKFLSISNSSLSLAIALYYFLISLGEGSNVVKILLVWKWIDSVFLKVDFSFLIDNLTIIMSITVLFVSLLVQIYSVYYMWEDKNFSKFFSYLNLFTFFMMILIASSNFIMMFLGWEGVGLCSFLLISFWNTRPQANKAASKAMLINRSEIFFF